jgi:tetratricopeptide (TPR) repeat protein
MMTAIAQIIGKLTSAYHLSGLYSILGVLYRLSGQIHAAIDCHQQSGAIAAQQINSISIPPTRDLTFLNLKNWEQHALFNTGICQIELWELEKALVVFEELLTRKYRDPIAENFDDLHNPSVDVLAAFLYSCLGDRDRAAQLLEGFDRAAQLQPLYLTGHRLLFLGLTYKNLGETLESHNMFQRAIVYANENHYTQVRANALSGLAELYRGQQDFERAISYHLEAVELLEQIGTKCDLAEANYQLGLTWQMCDRPAESRANFDRAIQLFQEMSAPKQIEKVQRAYLM